MFAGNAIGMIRPLSSGGWGGRRIEAAPAGGGEEVRSSRPGLDEKSEFRQRGIPNQRMKLLEGTWQAGVLHPTIIRPRVLINDRWNNLVGRLGRGNAFILLLLEKLWSGD